MFLLFFILEVVYLAIGVYLRAFGQTSTLPCSAAVARYYYLHLPILLLLLDSYC